MKYDFVYDQFVSTHEISQEALNLFEEYDNNCNMNFYSTIIETEQNFQN